MSVNKVILIGNVGAEPEVKYLDNNSKVARISLATTEKFKDRQGQTQERTEWHKVVAFNGLADIIEKYIRKGSRIFCEGHLRTRDYNDQQGVKKFVTEVVLENMQMLDRREQTQEMQGMTQYIQGARQVAASQPARTPLYQQAQQQPVVVEQPKGDGDDLPF